MYKKSVLELILKQLNIRLTYSEISLYLMSISFLLLLVINNGMRKEILLILDTAANSQKGGGLITYFLLALIGSIYCIFHVFSTAKKSKYAKTFMVIFGTTITIGSSVSTAVYVYYNRPWYLAFPAAVNILYAFLIYVLYKQEKFSVSDKNTKQGEAFIGSMAVLIIFLVSDILLKAHWSLTFSSCVFYALLLNDKVKKLFPKLYRM